MATAKPDGDAHVNPKLPSWDGNWATWNDYKFQVELEVDSTASDDICRLGPKLVRNLTSKAWEAVSDIDRDKLKKEGGIEYMLEHLQKKRGRLTVDLLGDALSSYFQKSEIMRREGESWSDYEVRHDHHIREISKALKAIGSSNPVPSEIFGWFMLHQFLEMEPSDIATVKSVSASYKLEDVYGSMRKLWGGDALPLKDAERKKIKSASRVLMVDDDTGEFPILAAEDDEEDEYEPNDHDEVHAMYEEAAEALLADPTNPEVLANFQETKKLKYTEARRALDRARTSRGFFPKGRGKGGRQDLSQVKCIRCGKMGHKAQSCRQAARDRPSPPKENNGRVGFVGGSWPLPEDALPSSSVLVTMNVPEVYECEPQFIGSAIQDQTRNKAVIDCGATESIVGDFMLQDFQDELCHLGFDGDAEVKIDRAVRRNFLFGNSETSRAIGLAQVTAGICGQEKTLDVHVVQGGTPFLLSSRWLYEQEAVINFKTGKACFPHLSEKQVQLERSPSFHLLLPLTAFQGNEELLQSLLVEPEDEDSLVNALAAESTVPDREASSQHAAH
jgi:hypothetical protein